MIETLNNVNSFMDKTMQQAWKGDMKGTSMTNCKDRRNKLKTKVHFQEGTRNQTS